jgi:hypothetical protein
MSTFMSDFPLLPDGLISFCPWRRETKYMNAIIQENSSHGLAGWPGRAASDSGDDELLASSISTPTDNLSKLAKLLLLLLLLSQPGEKWCLGKREEVMEDEWKLRAFVLIKNSARGLTFLNQTLFFYPFQTGWTSLTRHVVISSCSLSLSLSEGRTNGRTGGREGGRAREPPWLIAPTMYHSKSRPSADRPAAAAACYVCSGTPRLDGCMDRLLLPNTRWHTVQQTMH